MRKIKSLLAIVLMFALMFTLAGCGEIKKAEATVNGMFTALTLDGCGLVGRPGGDEFSAIIEKTIEKHELESLIDGFSADILTVLPDPHRVSCSIGALARRTCHHSWRIPTRRFMRQRASERPAML